MSHVDVSVDTDENGFYAWNNTADEFVISLIRYRTPYSEGEFIAMQIGDDLDLARNVIDAYMSEMCLDFYKYADGQLPNTCPHKCMPPAA
jgi:hypothetical protein